MKKYQSEPSKHITQNVSTTQNVIRGGVSIPSGLARPVFFERGLICA